MNEDLPTIDADIKADALRVIWEKCFREEVCVKIPFDGTKCVSASGCVRILLEGGVYKIEVELFGARKKFDLLNQCITGFTVGIASLKVCISKLKIVDGQLKGVRIDVRLCIGTKIGPINIEKCWDVIGQDINFFYRSELNGNDRASQASAMLSDAFELAALNEFDFVYIDEDDSCCCK